MIYNNNKEAIVAEGFTAKQWVDLLSGNKQADAAKSLNYFDGQQEDEIVKVLNDPNRRRKHWRTKGLTPRSRNLTKMIVEKSGLLFKDAAPILEVFQLNSPTADDKQSTTLAEELAKIEWSEFAINLDQVVRLLKTAIVLIQWDADEKQLVLDTLHRGNCEVVIDPATRKPRAMIHRYSSDATSASYSIWTREERIDLQADDKGTVTVGERQPNPYGVVPIAVFYDTNSPRTGFWVEQDKSVVNLNEMVNLHMTDSEYSILWSKMSTAITNMLPKGAAQGNNELISDSSGELVAAEVMGGPGEVVYLDSMGVESPFFRYEKPNIDLQPLDNVVNTWIQNVASDWSVRVHAAGETAANSGFQLVVEEMANLDLRRQRQRMFEQSFKRFYRVVARILNIAHGRTVLDEGADLFAKFSPPVLPVDVAAQEEIWSKRIAEGRASLLDYFMQEQGMTKEEAQKKVQEIAEFNKWHESLTGATPEEQTIEQETNTATALQQMSQSKSQ